MKIIIVHGKHGESKTLSLSWWSRAFLSLCLIGAPVSAGAYFSYKMLASDDEVLDLAALEALRQQTTEQQKELARTRTVAEHQLQALTLRVAELQARIVRLDALGERITTIAKLDKGEFDFAQGPALGGPESGDLGAAYSNPEFIDTIDGLVARIDNRQQQLEILESLLANRKLQDEKFVAGRPIIKGWMSSRFGRRNDPFTGRLAMHEGVDFAGKLGSDIIAVASGVVTWSGERYGYGQMVEINHGGGFVTRYAHNQEHRVKVGDIVKKGQVIAQMGSSGRSTGPHVHFEVYKHGRPVDPASYIHRASR